MSVAKPAVALALLSTAALGCQTADLPTTADDPLVPRPQLVTAREPDYEELEVCKYGSSATFSFTGPGTSGTVTLADGECRVLVTVGGAGGAVSVTEDVSLLPPGFSLDSVRATVVVESGGVPVEIPRIESGPTVSDNISGTPKRGILVEFFNSGETGQGCTPGYWKQRQHFDSWPPPYLPGDLFAAYFANAFPGKTLLQVLGLGGSGLNGLGRHTVAALLNAASSGVNYPLTEAQVIGMFNAAFASGNYTGTLQLFAAFNEAPCPLN